jgi:hypothetical protein
MSALPSGSGVAARLAPAKPKTRGFLHIVRHGAGPHAIYVVTYHRLGHDGPSAVDGHPERGEHASVPSASLPSAPHSATPIGAIAASAPPKPVLAEGAQALIELLERIGVDFRLGDVRGALEDILRLGSANIPDLWLSDEEMLEKGLVES